MELYVLDSLLRRVEVVDQFESLIWTERFAEIGDFQLVVTSTRRTRSLFTTGTRLAANVSYRVMTVETVENTVDADGKQMLKVNGRSLEAILDDRVAKDALSDLTTKPKWTLTGTPGAIARKVFHDVCVTGVLDVADRIPFIFEGAPMFPADTITEPAESVTIDLELQSVYGVEKQICEMYDLGFRLVRNQDMSQLYFSVYSGVNRTTSQTSVDAVVFSSELDNLQNTSELSTIAQSKNVAYVFSPAGFRVVYALGVDPTTDGFERRVLFVQADDITSDNPDVQGALLQRGLEELSKNRTVFAFDGELNQYSSYRYGVHYNLGDLVEQRNSDGVTNQMRVTEQIFAQDGEGERAYPTLAMNTYIGVGDWAAWDFGQTWSDLGLEEWGDEP